MSYTSYLNIDAYPRGFRNNNPGNLVRTSIAWEGKISHDKNTDARFEQFKELRFGIRALYRDIISDYKKGLTTVTALISEFAPAFENNTSAYIGSVISSVGGDVIPELTEEKLVLIAKAIIRVENGLQYAYLASEKDYQDALQILGVALKKKAMKPRFF